MRQLGSDVELLGPGTKHPVVVGGRQVPYLEAWEEAGSPDRVWVSVPGRMLDLPADDAGRVIQFVADAIAVGMGYVNHPGAGREPVVRTPFPVVRLVDSVMTDAGVLDALESDG